MTLLAPTNRRMSRCGLSRRARWLWLFREWSKRRTAFVEMNRLAGRDPFAYRGN